MKALRLIADMVAAAGAILFALILLLRIAAPRVGPIELQWPAPTASPSGSSPAFNANEPPRTLQVSPDGFDWCIYQPLAFPEALPPERLYLSLQKSDLPFDNGPWTNIPNPALQDFRKQHPPVRRIWQHGAIWSDERLIEHWGPSSFPSYTLFITGTVRSWHVPYWLLLLATGSFPTIWIVSAYRRRFAKGVKRSRHCPSCGGAIRASAYRCSHCGICSRPAVTGLSSRLFHLAAAASFLTSLFFLTAWVLTARSPALITWSSSVREIYPPPEDSYLVLSQWNLAIGNGGVCVANTHDVEPNDYVAPIMDADADYVYKFEIEWPHYIERGKLETAQNFKKTTADLIKSFNTATTPPMRWWERLGVTASNIQYDELRPANTCRGVRLPLWMIVVSAILLPGHLLLRTLIARGRWKQGHCVVCGYDLRSSTSRCPECGIPIATDNAAKMLVKDT